MTNNETQELISDESTLTVLKILMFGITPAISILGVIGNIFSIVILIKHGFRKCSNIMLISLAINDIMYLIGFNNIPKMLYELTAHTNGFSYSRGVAYALFILYCVCILMDHGSGAMSLTLPVLITLERLTAVFLPLKFHLIFTPVRTWCIVIGLQILAYAVFLYIVSDWLEYVYVYDSKENTSVGYILRSDYFYQNLDVVTIIEETIVYVSIKFPPIITFVGCVAIGVKVKIASQKRKKMMSYTSEVSSNRTTKMLLAVCFVYTIACAITSLPTLIPGLSYEISSDSSSNVSKIVYQVSNITLCINSSCNFVIYVVMNKNFRDTYKSLFPGCFSHPQVQMTKTRHGPCNNLKQKKIKSMVLMNNII